MPDEVERVALLTTVHDPDGRFLAALSACGGQLSVYEDVYAAVTDATDNRLIDALRCWGVTVLVRPAGAVGPSLRTVVQAGLAGEHASFLYCDFDRWLFWAGTFPDELAALPATIAKIYPSAWYVCLGRTERAFATHPDVQQVAESATNRALSLAAGQGLDATAGACWLSRDGAALILAGSIETTKATDLEWPALILTADPSRLAGVALDGLEFETAAFYQDEIEAAGGRAAWIAATYDQPAVWRDRLRLAADSVAALARVWDR